MASVNPGFIRDIQTHANLIIASLAQVAALKDEKDTFSANGITITDADVQAVIPGMTAAQFNDTMTAIYELYIYEHDPTRLARLHRIKR